MPGGKKRKQVARADWRSLDRFALAVAILSARKKNRKRLAKKFRRSVTG